MSVTFYAAGAPDELDINMSNSNAATICAALGFSLDPDWCGEMSALDFQGRVLMALAISPADEGMPSYEHQGAGARMIEGARRPGYLQERLGQLHELAAWAVANNVAVVWA
jgi:hypothetical protein